MTVLRQPLFINLTFVLFLLGCNPLETQSSFNASCTNRVAPNYNSVSEAAYCSTVTSYSSPVTITGSAKYYPRETYVSGLGDQAATGSAIRYAEVVVKDSAGTVVQCGETDASGNFSVQLATNGGQHTIYVRSRSDNSNVKASVLNCPEENAYYEISTTFTPDSSKAIGEIKAESSGDILAGAFNILDKIVDANDYLRTQVGTCAFDNCADFSVAPKVSAYWQKGYNPNNYFGSSSGVSFYLPGESKLFILGGINGDTDYSDTDHFDNSVILHEYGHFLEDIYTKTDSPGGSHSGNKVIDPRLAWGEGWGNFFQAAVQNTSSYIDTSGNKDGSTSYIFNIPLEAPDGGCTSSTPGCDIPSASYEGQFREFAIARFLWDVVDDASETGDDIDGTAANVGFPEIWAAMVSSTGFLNTNIAFRDIGLLNYTQINKLTGSTPLDWSNLRTDTNSGLTHFQGTDRKEYAYYVDDDDSCSGATWNHSMTPYNDSNDTGSFATSNQFHNNDFFHYYHPGGAFNLQLEYSTTGSAQEADLDLYIYKDGYTYGTSSDIATYSEDVFDNNTATNETESVSTNLTLGHYLINVKLYTGTMAGSSCQNGLCPGDTIPLGGTTEYKLTLGGKRVCPTTPP